MAKIGKARRISGQDRYQTSRIIQKDYYQIVRIATRQPQVLPLQMR